MRVANEHYKAMRKLVDELSNMAARSPISGMGARKYAINKDALDRWIEDMSNALDDSENDLPQELAGAKKVIEDKEYLVSDAKSKARLLINQAEDERKRMLEHHELIAAATERAHGIVQDAEEKAANIKARAKRESKDIHMNVLNFMKETFDEAERFAREMSTGMADAVQAARDAESSISDCLNDVYENKRTLMDMLEKEQDDDYERESAIE